MSKTKGNTLTPNYSGKFADQFVMRTRGYKSFLACLPKKVKVSPEVLPGWQARQRKFQLAGIYSQKAKENPALMEAYANACRGNQTAFNVAFQDAYNGPELSDLRTDGYKGEAGQPIVVHAIDDFKVAKVFFTLLTADGTTLETGEAVQDDNGWDWVYLTKAVNPSLPGTIIQVTAEDIPKNQATLEARL